jgi:hypothetical protein
MQILWRPTFFKIASFQLSGPKLRISGYFILVSRPNPCGAADDDIRTQYLISKNKHSQTHHTPTFSTLTENNNIF